MSLEMNAFTVMSKPACKSENVSPMEISRDFPLTLSHQKSGQNVDLNAVSPMKISVG